MKTTFATVLLITLISFLTGCGGGGDTTYTISGQVDGADATWTVGADYNRDGNLSSTEPKTTVGADGSYTLTASIPFAGVTILAALTSELGTASFDGATILAAERAPARWFKIVSAQRMKTQGKSEPNVFISPITTLVQDKVEAGTELETAKNEVKADLGLDGDPLEKYEEDSDDALISEVVALVIAMLIEAAIDDLDSLDEDDINIAFIAAVNNIITALEAIRDAVDKAVDPTTVDITAIVAGSAVTEDDVAEAKKEANKILPKIPPIII